MTSREDEDKIKQSQQAGSQIENSKSTVEKEKKVIWLPVGQENVAVLPNRKEPRQAN